MPLPSRAEQLATAIRHFERDGVVVIKDRPGNVAPDLIAWATERGIPVTRVARTLGRATHWEIRRA